MTLYKGKALTQQAPTAKPIPPAVAGTLRPRFALNAERDASRDEDDGRGDEAHPDSGWVEGFNADQRGER